MKKAISTDKAPAAIGPYSQAIEVNGMVYTSGVIPVVPSTGEIPEGAAAHSWTGAESGGRSQGNCVDPCDFPSARGCSPVRV